MNYSIKDISIIIPQYFKYPKRYEWFLPQFMPSVEGIKENILVVIDDGDDVSINLTKKYGLNYIETIEYQSHLKIERALPSIKTDLVIRMHDDIKIIDQNWLNKVVEFFNQDDDILLGIYFASGNTGLKFYQYILEYYDGFRLLGHLHEDEVEYEYVHGSFIASTSEIMRKLTKLTNDFTVKYNGSKMDKEDVLMTQFAYNLGIKHENWHDIEKYLSHRGYSNWDVINDEGFIK